MKRINKLSVFVTLVSVVVSAAVIAGLFLAGTPEQARLRQFDDRRVNDLQEISRGIDVYYLRKEALPQQLDDLTKERGIYLRSVYDPKTEERYAYRVIDELRYELCATFDTDTIEESAKSVSPRPFREQFWNHGVGEICFSLEVQTIDAPPTPTILRLPRP